MPRTDSRNLTGRPFAQDTSRLDADVCAKIDAPWPRPFTWYGVGCSRAPRALWVCECGRRARFLYKALERESTRPGSQDTNEDPDGAPRPLCGATWHCRRCATLQYESGHTCRATRAAQKAAVLRAKLDKGHSLLRARREEEVLREEMVSWDINEAWFLDAL